MRSSIGLRAAEAFERAFAVAPTLTAHATDEVCVCDWTLPWLDGFELRENDDFVIAYHSAGSERVRAACSGPWSATRSVPGLTSVIPPGNRVAYLIEGGVSFCSIHIPAGTLRDLLGSQLAGAPTFRFAFDDPFARSCVDILMHQARQDRLRNFPYVRAVTHALLLHLVQAFRTDIDANGEWRGTGQSDIAVRLQSVLSLIDSHLGDSLNLDTLAARAGMSRSHFARRFRRFTGVSAHRYLNLRRIEKAKQLLRRPAANLTEIALELGFSSQSHFTQTFREVTGCTPKEYRRSPRGI